MENTDVKIGGHGIFSAAYWKSAAKNLTDVKMIVVAALMIALRIAVKPLAVNFANFGLRITFDCYVNSIGSMIYGPLVGLLVGLVSDPIGYMLFPSPDPYFLPFILVEMLSSFIFGMFLWKRELSVGRILLSKFTVNLVCNIILTSIFNKWSKYIFLGVEKAEAYNIINGVRIVKNLVLFPLEATFIALFMAAILPALKALDVVSYSQEKLVIKRKHIIAVIALTVFSVALVLFYIFWLKDFVSAHNIKLF